MKRGILIILIALLAVNVSAVCMTPEDGPLINKDAFFCSGDYTIDAGISVSGKDFTLDCKNSILTGSKSGKGITITDSKNITVKNCVVQDFDIGIYILNSKGIFLENNNLAANRIPSTVYGEFIEIPLEKKPIIIKPQTKQQTLEDHLISLGVSKENYEDAIKDIAIEKRKDSITSYTVFISPRRNIASVKYYETGVFDTPEELKDLRKGEAFSQQLSVSDDQEPISIVFDKKLTWWNSYLLILAVLMLALIHFASSFEARHKDYMYVKRTDPFLHTFLSLERFDDKAKKIGFVFFTFFIVSILMPVIDIFTVQFIGTAAFLLYVFYFLRLVMDVKAEEEK